LLVNAGILITVSSSPSITVLY